MCYLNKVIHLLQDLKSNVERIAELLDVKLSPQQLETIVTGNTFENKKKELGSNHPVYRKGKKQSSKIWMLIFLRLGFKIWFYYIPWLDSKGDGISGIHILSSIVKVTLTNLICRQNWWMEIRPHCRAEWDAGWVDPARDGGVGGAADALRVTISYNTR